MTAIQDTAPARARAARKLPTGNSAHDTETWLESLDHLDTAESIVLTVLRRMGSEEDWLQRMRSYGSPGTEKNGCLTLLLRCPGPLPGRNPLMGTAPTAAPSKPYSGLPDRVHARGKCQRHALRAVWLFSNAASATAMYGMTSLCSVNRVLFPRRGIWARTLRRSEIGLKTVAHSWQKTWPTEL